MTQVPKLLTALSLKLYNMGIGEEIMITNIRIENLIITEILDIKMTDGMTAITGATGAGKSVILSALRIAFGGRVVGNIQRDNSLPSSIEISIHPSQEVRSAIAEMEIPCVSGEDVVLRVNLWSGRRSNFINGVRVTSQNISNIFKEYILFVGQNSARNLLDPQYQMDMYDIYAGAIELRGLVSKKSKEIKEIKKDIHHAKSKAMERRDRVDLLNIHLDIIKDSPVFVDGGESFGEFEEKYKRVVNSEQIRYTLSEAERLSSEIMSAIEKIERLGLTKEYAEYIETIKINAGEFNYDVGSDLADTNITDKEIDYYQQKMEKINSICKRFMITPEEIPLKYQEIIDELNCNEDNVVEQLREKLEEAKLEYDKLSSDLGKQRVSKIENFVSEINPILKSLRVGEQVISLEVAESESGYPETGREEIRIVFSPNGRSGTLDSASGGELSRMELAIKKMLSDKVKNDVVFFDEIDAGVGGEESVAIAGILGDISKYSQIITITHSHQIAIKAKSHIIVSKSIDSGSTTQSVVVADKSSRVAEVARMVAIGDNEAAMEYAASMTIS